MKLLVKMIFLVCAVFLQSYSFCSDSPLWLIEEEFIKIGKKMPMRISRRGGLVLLKANLQRAVFGGQKTIFGPFTLSRYKQSPNISILYRLKTSVILETFLKNARIMKIALVILIESKGRCFCR